MKTKLLLLIFTFVSFMISCTKDECSNTSNVSDNTVSAMATSPDGLDLIHSSRTNDNSEWKIKMNDAASKAYAEGNNNYPKNSMIVKEKYDASGALTGYDVKFKSPGNENSVDGWLWTSLSSEGKVIYASYMKGASCQSCHGPKSESIQLH